MAAFVTQWFNFSSFLDGGGGSGNSYNAWGVPACCGPSAAQYQDGTSAYAEGGSPSTGNTNWLYAKNISAIDVPVGAAIKGIELGVYAYAMQGSTSNVSPNGPMRASLLIGGARSGSIKSFSIPACFEPACYSLSSIGGQSEMFGLTHSRSSLNDSGFGFAIQGLSTGYANGLGFYIDHMKIRFYYDQIGILSMI